MTIARDGGGASSDHEAGVEARTCTLARASPDLMTRPTIARASPDLRARPAPRGSPDLRKSRFDSKPVLRNSDLRAIFLVNLVNFLDSLGGSISTPILPFYAHEFHASPGEIGQLFSAFALAQTCSMPALGYASDRYGRRIVLLLSLVGAIFGALWQGMATTYASLLGARIFSGTWAGVSSVCQIYIVDVVPPEHRAQYLSYYLSSTQASLLFGPSIGAGLSVLGLNMPFFVQASVSAFLLPIVWAYFPESPEWLRLHNPDPNGTPKTPSQPTPRRYSSSRASPAVPYMKPLSPGIGRSTTRMIIASFGLLSMCGMVTQMSVVSMFAVFAKETYGLDSLRVGFIMTLGAVASIATNIWISPHVQDRLGQVSASILGFVIMVVGTLGTVMKPVELSIAGIMLTYHGLAINASAIATGAANLTDYSNRATVMTGVRMFKSFGAVAGPLVAGQLATVDVRLPFMGAAAGFALLGTTIQLLTIPLIRKTKILLDRRATVGLKTGLLEGVWQDEYGTPEEIRDIGEYVADLLTARHYRWVTYNKQLKSYLSDAFPPVPHDSEEQHKKVYDQRRALVKELFRDAGQMNYAELRKCYDALQAENADLRAQLQDQEASDEDYDKDECEEGEKAHFEIQMLNQAV